LTGVSTGVSTAEGLALGELESSNIIAGLSRAERDDAANWIVRGDPHGDAVTRNNLYAEAAHTAAELGKHLMPRIALNTIKTSAVHCHYRSLHVDQVVFAQTGSKSFLTS